METINSSEKDLFIIGCGGLGREVAWLVERINKVKPTWKFKGFIDDLVTVGTRVGDYLVIGNTDDLLNKYKNSYCVCAIAQPNIRERIVSKLISSGYVKFATLIDPSAIISDSVRIGHGCIICAGCILTVNITVKDNSIINPGTTIGHDTVISEYCTLYPGSHISGNVNLDTGVQIGAGAVVLQGLYIGTGSFIGAGSTVISNISSHIVAVGCPAKPK